MEFIEAIVIGLAVFVIGIGLAYYFCVYRLKVKPVDSGRFSDIRDGLKD